MSRHHPYGPQYDNVGPRRGGPPSGPGPDRYHRFDGPPRGRGFGRGRGRGSFTGASHDFASSHPVYDQAPSQGNMGGYNNYDNSGPNQDSFYQNGGGFANQFSDSDTPGGYDQSYGNGNFQDGQSYGGPGGYGAARLPKRGPKRERDDKVHESIIEERIQRERPCRTLFIRNIKYETNSDEVRRQFEEHGEIKTFFDLIANRGMVFVTFYDLRAAERARERLQGSEISGRPIDVHYSLPRDDNLAKGGDKNQGTLLVTLRNSSQAIDDGEVRRKFQQFGDVKSVRSVGERHDQRYVEFYDTRSAEEAFDRLRHQGLQDGVMDIVLAWEEGAGPGPRRDERESFRDWDDAPRPAPFRGRARGRGRGRGFAGHDDDRRPHWDRDRDRPKRYDDDHGSGRGGGRGSYNDRFDASRDGGYSNAPQNTYGLSGQSQYSEPSASAPAQPVEDRIDQARKVQQLLAALKQPQAASGAQPTPVQAQPPAPVPQIPQMPPNSFYPPAPTVQQPPPIFPGAAPQSTSGFPSLPQTSLPQSGPPPAQGNPLANLPSNILALLQNVQAQQQPSGNQQPPQSTTPLPAPYGAGPPTLPPGQMRPSMPPHLTGLPPPTVPMQGRLGGDYPGQMMNYYGGAKRS